MFLVSPLSSRNQFGNFLNERGLVEKGVEVGTHRGEYASTLLKHWKGTLYCIDPWRFLPEYENQSKFLEGSNGNRQLDYLAAKTSLAPYGPKAVIRKKTSREGANDFREGSVDFVYLDGNHERPYIDEDISLWYPKVKSGGILAGHDVVCPGPPSFDNWGKHIQNALIDFYRRVNLANFYIYLIIEEGGLPWSWYLEKP